MTRLFVEAINDPKERFVVEGLTGDLQARRATLQDLAEAVYSEAYKGVDDKYFRKTKTSEIYDWLSEGDLRDAMTLEALSAEWLEYDQLEEKEEA